MPETFSLEMPPNPAYLSTARQFAASVGRHVGCPEHLIEDLKLAVSEACSVAITRNADPRRPVSLHLTRDEESLRIDVENGGGPPSGELSSILREGLVPSLFPIAVTTPSEGGGQDVSFSVPFEDRTLG